MILEIIKAVVYGIVEGITEWLPISSTGHLILLEQWLPLNASDAFMEMFDVVIQLGAILAVIVLFFRISTGTVPVDHTPRSFMLARSWAGSPMVKEAIFFEKTGSSPSTAPLTVTLSPGAAFLASETTSARGRPTMFSANLTAICWVTF